jgi:hypothetical protein
VALFGEGCRAIVCVKFRSQISTTGVGILGSSSTLGGLARSSVKIAASCYHDWEVTSTYTTGFGQAIAADIAPAGCHGVQQ